MHLLGVDVAEHRIHCVAVDDEGRVVRRVRRDGSGGNFQAVVREAAAGLTLDAFGIATERPLDQSPELRAAEGVPQPVGCAPGAAAVTAEAWIGGARGARDVVCLKVGERVFAGILLDGKIWKGAHGHAGSAAWLAINPVERQDYRKFGGLAAEVSSQGIARRLMWRVQAGDDSDVVSRAGNVESITAAHVFEGARAGDGVAISVVRDTARYIGMAIANLALSVDPQVAVLSGDAAAAADLLLTLVQQEYVRRMPPEMANQVTFAISPLGDDGVAIGAARLAALSRRTF